MRVECGVAKRLVRLPEGFWFDSRPRTIREIFLEDRDALPGGTVRCRLSLLANSAQVIRVQMRGEESCGVSAKEYSCGGAQINFGDLPPYLTYALCTIVHF